MSEEVKRFTEQEAHRYFGVECNNGTWNLLGKAERTKDEDERMLALAYASHYHWLQVGTAENKTRGEWMISRVHATLGHAALAMEFALRALETCERAAIGDFDLAYAFEAMARAHAASGNREDAREWKKKALTASNAISDREARQYFDSDFAAEPWYGVD